MRWNEVMRSRVIPALLGVSLLGAGVMLDANEASAQSRSRTTQQSSSRQVTTRKVTTQKVAPKKAAPKKRVVVRETTHAPSGRTTTVTKTVHTRRNVRPAQHVHTRAHRHDARPRVGTRVSRLPAHSVTVRRSGRTYHRHDGVYYSRVRLRHGGFAFEVVRF